MNMSYTIIVRNLAGVILTYKNVKVYELDKGMIKFTDSKTGFIQRFSPYNCEIKEVKDD